MLLLKSKLLSLILARWASENTAVYLLAQHLSELHATGFLIVILLSSVDWDLMSLKFVFENICTLKSSTCFPNCFSRYVLLIVSLF